MKILPSNLKDMSISQAVRALKTLDELFGDAREFGRVNLFTSDDGTYSVNIIFPTPADTDVKANSGFGHKTPHLALQFAIDKAHEIRKAFR